MTKVLFITEKLQTYRIPVLNIVGENDNIELTVAHSGTPLKTAVDKFHEKIINQKRIWKFTNHLENLENICNQFDVVVAMLYLQKISIMKLAFQKRRSFKLIYWGIGVKASQKSEFDAPGLSNYLRYVMASKADAMIFYSDYPIKKYLKWGIKREKLFVMNNTVKVEEKIMGDHPRDSLLFIGTLNKSKKIFKLFESYKEAYNVNPNLPKINIIGGGPDFENAKIWVENNNISGKIFIHGPIYDENMIELFFKKALACVSPGQAGLSVLTSMGYGVPFITHKNAITGGERLNITNNKNGILFHKYSELTEIILDVAKNNTKYIEMGKNAKEYYYNCRTPEQMAEGFLEGVKYVLKR